MTTCNNSIHFLGNRLRLWRNLLFFAAILGACRQGKEEIAIEWKDHKAIAVRIPESFVKEAAKDPAGQQVVIINDNDSSATPIFGSFTAQNGNGLRFEPLVPFTNGMRYSVMVKDRRAARFSISFEEGDPPRVIAVFPGIDTVPENLLKIYLVFSHPMREGVSRGSVHLMKNAKDTLRDVFLDLQPELWNQDRTVLTLWLDPGRIKRDLQPNLKLGAPLHSAERYTLLIAKEWTDAQGKPLQHDYTQTFTTSQRNERSPNPSHWKINIPAANGTAALAIRFDQPLDHFLLMESLSIKDVSGKPVQGTFTTIDKDRACHFIPAQPWVKGVYEVVIDSKLEDLAGNNLNRPFDRDVTTTQPPSSQAFYTLRFTINP